MHGQRTVSEAFADFISDVTPKLTLIAHPAANKDFIVEGDSFGLEKTRFSAIRSLYQYENTLFKISTPRISFGFRSTPEQMQILAQLLANWSESIYKIYQNEKKFYGK